MCYEEHKKKYPNENVQVTEISKKCSEKWKVRTYSQILGTKSNKIEKNELRYSV